MKAQDPLNPNKFTDKEYQAELDWLYQQMPNYQIDGKKAYKPGLENIEKLCDFFGNPHLDLKMIHIGGTNGKGSTSHMLSSILQKAGYNVGLYTSPHLIEFTERIKVNGQEAPRAFVYRFIQRLKELPTSIRPSFFEFTTVMAFEYFRETKVDYAIIEVGLGGRLDSTNIITPLLTAITNVALDHTDLLGETKEKIAFEKAGIIKQGIPILTGEKSSNIKTVLQDVASSKNAPIYFTDNIEAPFSTDLKGSYQHMNLKLVFGLVQELKKLGLDISDKALEQGLLHVQETTNFLGRWHEISKDPLIICDTAHNHAGLIEVFKQLESLNRFKHIVLGFVKDKDINEVLMILPSNSKYYFAPPDISRGRNPREYENLLKISKIDYEIFDSVQNAYLSALKNITEKEMIFIGGSNFVVGEFLQKNL